MTTGHRVRCTCWWLDVSGIDEPPHSSYVRSFSEPDCPAHPSTSAPAVPYRVTGAQASLEYVERRRPRIVPYLCLMLAAVGLAIAFWGVYVQNPLGVVIGMAIAVGSPHLPSLTC